MTKSSSEFGKTDPAAAAMAQADPFGQEKRDLQEKDAERTGTTDSGLGIRRGPFGFLRGAWARIGVGIRFRVPRSR
jgi:hypothetical protein